MPTGFTDRLFLIPRLRSQMHVAQRRLANARIYAVDCSPDELLRVDDITLSDIQGLSELVCSWLDVRRRLPRVRVIIIGERARVHLAPKGIKHWVDRPFGQAGWFRRVNAAVILCARSNSIRQSILHELTHAFLDILTNGFPFLIAIQEGYAMATEHLIPRNGRPRDLFKGPTPPAAIMDAYVRADQCMSVQELLFFDTHAHWRKDIVAFSRMTLLGSWLHCFLGYKSIDFPVIRKMLSKLWHNDIRTPEGTYLWLQETLEMREAELERAFLRFCTTGHL